jgi:phage gp36-like protein
MPYCTQADLETRYSTAMLVALSDRGATPTGTVDAAFVARAIADAAALIDGYLKGVYALPLAATPAVVTDLALRIAIYYLHGQSVPDKIRQDHEQALRQLRDIAAGVLKLDAAGLEPAPSGASEVLTNEPVRPLTAGSLSGYI